MHKIGKNIIAFLPPETIEAAALEQIKNTASVPFLFNHVAVMPDTHFGKGSTVGTVLPTKGAIIPAAVGVDIGCGMIAVKTNLKKEQLGDLSNIRHSIERRRTDILLDEIPAAYKDIDEVMENAKSLVKIDEVLKQILNVKGD